ncbi:MAG: hypothetical protein OXR73_28085 [Myxococcales bacterium]|nr:hypothetical protein [Myxococcales bacterium]
MPRLLRVHFASIGHRDARLAPLTLDFRHGGESSQTTGTGADSVLWLRNGGGKSSIINLFYSVFRPRAREFLGSSAEGKARRLVDYVKASDLAFVITEWDITPQDTLDLFPQAPEHLRVVGQMLAWRSGQRSADLSNFERLWFSGLGGERGLRLEDLPVQGLAAPVASFGAFKDYLRERSHVHPDAEIVFTQVQRKWEEHLESVGLDPEQFRYQLEMNRREGAADEAFRFDSADEFVQFLLELAFDRAVADQLALTLDAQRVSLRERPRYELEQGFVAAGLEALRPLSASIAQLAARRTALEQSLLSLGGLIAGLRQRATDLEARQRAAARTAEEAAARLQEASNERDKHSRWSRGLQRLALELDLREAERACDAANARLADTEGEAAEARAAQKLGLLRLQETKLRDLHAALADKERDAAPLRETAEMAGATLRGALGTRLSEVAQQAETFRSLASEQETRRQQAQADHREAVQRATAAGQEAARLTERLDARDRARERLLTAGEIERRETAAAAVERWRTQAEQGRAAEVHANQEAARASAAADDLSTQRSAWVEDRATTRNQLETLRSQFEEAEAWRERLASHPRIQETEAVEVANLEASGLMDRLRQRAAAARNRCHELRATWSSDERAMQSIDREGYLPPAHDVERVVQLLRAQQVSAHSGARYLAENAPHDGRARLLRADPARFGGVIVTSAEDLARARQIAIDGLSAPVQTSTVQSLDGTAKDDSSHVFPPDPALYDERAAQHLLPTLERQVAEAKEQDREMQVREREFTSLADELQRYQHQHGQGKLPSLERRVQAAKEHVAIVERQLEQIGAEIAEMRAAASTARTQAEQHADQASQSEKALSRVELFYAEHERDLDGLRARRDRALQDQTAAQDQALVSQQTEEEAAAERDEHRKRARVLLEEQRGLRAEHDSITYVAETGPAETGADEPELDLPGARQRYETARRIYDDEVSDNRLRWEAEQAEEIASALRTEHLKLAEGLDPARIEAMTQYRDLDAHLSELAKRAAEQRELLGSAKSDARMAKQRLDEAQQRREAADLPSDEGPPPTAAAARKLARAHTDKADAAGMRLREYEAALAAAREEVATLQRGVTSCNGRADGLEKVVTIGSGLSLPAAPPQTLPAGEAELDQAVSDAEHAFTQARKGTQQAEEETRTAVERLHRVANDPTYASLQVQYRRRMLAERGELLENAERLLPALETRRAVIEDQLAQYDEDRRVLVEELLQLSDQVASLLKRAGRASVLPQALEGWGGKPYLRIDYRFPDTDIDRRARLEPLVDRIVQQAQVPDGLSLVCAAARELAGARGFDVRILKPDVVLRPDPIPLTEMASFSRGQQLTAAIVLYCTLVQLRARTRGRVTTSRDAGVLILDNPIGTCSSVPLLRLQRSIAAQMRVQLVYATGVEDLEALEILPNKVRLRNTHRDRRSGDFHVTIERDDRGALEAVRVVEVPAR